MQGPVEEKESLYQQKYKFVAYRWYAWPPSWFGLSPWFVWTVVKIKEARDGLANATRMYIFRYSYCPLLYFWKKLIC